MKYILTFTFIVSVVMLFTSASRAEMVEFPQEELSRESVLPIFDQPEAVKKRTVPFADRYQLEGFAGMGLSDPFYNAYPVGIEALYHLNDIHAAGLRVAWVASSQTSYVPQIQQLPNANSIPFASAPSMKYFALGEYEFTPYYGKISLTKQNVMNLSISGTVFGGAVGMDAETSPGFGVGLNERFLFTRNLGIKIDLRAMFYQQTDVVVITPAKRNVVNLFLTVGAVYFLPQL